MYKEGKRARRRKGVKEEKDCWKGRNTGKREEEEERNIMTE